jgi:hypothetical protein
MKAEELFKTKAEVAAVLDEKGIDYPKIKTGTNAGLPTLTFKQMCDLYDGIEITSEEVNPIINTPTVSLLIKSFGIGI